MQSSLTPFAKLKVFAEHLTCRQMMRRIQKLQENLIRSVSWFFLYPCRAKNIYLCFRLLHNHSKSLAYFTQSYECYDHEEEEEYGSSDHFEKEFWYVYTISEPYNIKPNSFVLVSCSLTLTFIVKQGGRYSAEVLRQ